LGEKLGPNARDALDWGTDHQKSTRRGMEGEREEVHTNPDISREGKVEGLQVRDNVHPVLGEKEVVTSWGGWVGKSRSCEAREARRRGDKAGKSVNQKDLA